MPLERVSIEVTNRCAKACAFCYNHSLPGGGTRWTPRPGQLDAGALTPVPPVDTHYLMFQLQLADGQRVDLVIERDHPAVMREAFDLLDALLQ